MKTKLVLCWFVFEILCFSASNATNSGETAATAINDIGTDLYKKLAIGENNLCLSPYSIETALAMTFVGADGATRDEMARVLHLSKEKSIHNSFSTLQSELKGMADRTVKALEQASELEGGPKEPITLAIANRLFAQKGYDFRQSFFAVVRENYGAPVEQMDFAKKAKEATKEINAWVLEQTRQRIRDLIPPDALNADTRLVLANAIYLKAPWEEAFSAEQTKPEPFHVQGGNAVDVPTLHGRDRSCGYAKRSGFAAVTIPYIGRDLQFVILLPDKVTGLPQIEKQLTSTALSDCAKLERRSLNLYLPKFKIEPPTLDLGSTLQTLGMTTAFDKPPGTADFDRMAPRKPDDYLYISDVFHKTFISVDEKGTEAAAATAVAMARATSMRNPEKPLEVRVDRPFFFAIQHVPSGACLFVGRVTDPR